MKRKILSIFIAACMLAALLPAVGGSALATTGGSGPVPLTSGATIVSGTTYTISNADQLGYLSGIVNGGQTCAGATFQLTADIDLNAGVTFTFDADTGLVEATNGTGTFYLGTGVKGTAGGNSTFDTTASTAGEIYADQSGTTGAAPFTLAEWTPIGDISHAFSGSFNGNGYTVSGIYINTSDIYQGLFGSNNFIVKDVSIENSYINGGSYVGGIAGYNSNSIENCNNTGIVIGGNSVGGISGYNSQPTVKNCTNGGYVLGESETGGIVGYFESYGFVENCSNSGCISGNDKVGGIAGHVASADSTLQYCYNTCSVSGSSNVGGIAGSSSSGYILYCYNLGMISGNDSAGGIVGGNINYISFINYCYNAGVVQGGDKIGGIVGNNDFESFVQYCYNVGGVSGTGSNIGAVAGANVNDSTVSDCYFDKQMCPFSDSTGATGMLTGELIMQDTLVYMLGSPSCWTQSGGLYPRLADPSGGGFDMDGTDAAYISATPIFLHRNVTTSMPYEYYTEDVSDVRTDFTLGTDHGVGWASSDTGVIDVNGSDADIISSGTDITLTATRNGVSKTVVIDAVTFNEVPLTDSVTHIDSGTRYTIGDAEQLRRLSSLVSGGETCLGATFRLTGDINLNAGWSFNFDWDTGLVKAAGGTDAYYLGTGVPGTAIGHNDTFDTTASTAGTVYTDMTGGTTGAGAFVPEAWTPIGDYYGNFFFGSFDGDGHTVSGIYINTDDINDIGQGLFGYIIGGTIKDISVASSYIRGMGFVSGIAGINSGTVKRCVNAATVIGDFPVGGIAGQNYYGNILNCSNTGVISGSGSVGGVAGQSVGNIVKYSTNKGSVYGGNYVGGIVGDTQGPNTVEYCVNTGAVTGDTYVGGVAGQNYANDPVIRYCYNLGVVSGDSMVGGIAGENSSGAIIEYCYNAGGIEGANYVGGVTGSNDFFSQIQYCYNVGGVSGTGSNVGAVAGVNVNDSTVLTCYYDQQMCTVGDSDAVGKLTAQMTGSALSLGDADNWTATANLYPRLADPAGASFDMDGTDAAYVSVTPVFLSGGDTAAGVSADFTVGTDNGVIWFSGNPGAVSIFGSTATLNATNTDVTLVAWRYGVRKIVSLTLSPGSGAELNSVAGQTDTTPGAQSGADPANAIKWEINVLSSVSSITSEDITVSMGASARLYSNAGFTNEITGASKLYLTEGSTTIAYIKVTSEDNATTKYYAVIIYRMSAPTSGGGTNVLVNGTAYNAGTVSTTTENGRSKTMVTIDSGKLNTILQQKGSNATVVIPVSSGADIVCGVLTGQMIKDLTARKATLIIDTGSATYSLPPSALDIDEIAKQFGQNVALSDIKVEITISTPTDSTVQFVENAAEEGGFTIIVPPVEFTVSCTYNGRTVTVDGFDAYVERTIKIPAGVDPSKITTAVVVNPNGTVSHVPTKLVVIDGEYFAVINSQTNSVYALIYNPIDFMDMQGHWARDTVNNMGSRKVITGYGDGTFAPDKDITRAEFTAIVVRALGLKAGIGENTFSDVAVTDWYCGYIETAVSYGLITGYTNGAFGPNDPITREQAMAIIARAMAVTGLGPDLTDAEISQLLAGYTDSNLITGYAVPGIAACIDTGVVVGKTADTIAPKAYITRAEVAVIAERLLEKSDLI